MNHSTCSSPCRRVVALAVVAAALTTPAVATRTTPESGSPTQSCAGPSGYWCESWRGWHFYEDPEPPQAPPPKPPPNTPPGPREARPDGAPPAERHEFDQLRKRLEDARIVAIVRPTEANVRRYMTVEAEVVRRASLFSDVAQRVAWSTPDLDMTLMGRPVNAQAIEVFDREQTRSRGETLAALARTHVLFFFFRSDCPYCHAFAPTLTAFQARHGIQVVPISIDGGGLPTFPKFRRDNGISHTLQVTQVPALYLAEPFTGRISPIGFGVLSESQLLERITTVTAPGAESLVPSATRHVSFK